MKPVLSIVVPIYNAAPWLCKCLDSLRAQTFLEWETLLIDDGSTDASADICREYVARDSRFHYWAQPHAGVVCARRNGVRHAVGAMVGFVDADDWVEPDMYQEMMAATARVEAVVCGYFRHSDKDTSIHHSFPGTGLYDGLCYEPCILNEMLCAQDRRYFDCLPMLWNTLLPSNLLRQTLEKMDERMHRSEDALCVYTCLLQLRSLECLERPLYHYRVHANSAMGRVGFRNYQDTALFYQQLIRTVEHLRPALLPQVDSLFLYLISLGIYENPALLRYPVVRDVLRRERLVGCCREWRRRVFRMRVKSLFAPRPIVLEEQEEIM